MIRPKLGIKVLVLCALVFAMMGIASSGAQAAGPEWLVLATSGGGGTVSEGVGDEVTLENDSALYVLHSKIAGITVLFECKKITASGVKLAALGTIAAGGKVLFHECITKLNGAESKVCEPTNGGTEKGLIVTKAGHGKLVLKEGLEQTEVVPDVGTTFAVIEMGPECAIGTKVPVIGTLFLKDCLNQFLEHKEKHLVEEGLGTKLFVISETAEHKATLLGSAWAKVKDSNGVFHFFAGHAG